VVPTVAGALLLAISAASPTSAQPGPTPAAEVVARPAMDPRIWCRPVVNAAVNPDPLSCWLSLAAIGPGGLLTGTAGMNLGDLPPFTRIDTEAISMELARFEQTLEAERAEAERPAADRRERQISAPDPAIIDEPDYEHARRAEEERQRSEPEPSPDPLPNGGWTNPWAGEQNEAPPMPAECNGSGHYDSSWGGWICAGQN